MIIKMVLLSFIVLSSAIAIEPWIVTQTHGKPDADAGKDQDVTEDERIKLDGSEKAPDADAGKDQDVTEDERIKLDGSEKAPEADAGKDQDVTEDERIKLDGSDSLAPNGGSIISWTWSVIGSTGPSPLLINPNTAHPTFSAIGISSDAKYTINLDVSDNLGKTDSDTVDIYAIPKAETSIEGGST